MKLHDKSQGKDAGSKFQQTSSRMLFAGYSFIMVSITHYSRMKIGLN